MNKQTAMDLGFTQLIRIETREQGIECLARPDADLGGTFRAFDVDENEWIDVNSWLGASLEVWKDGQWEELA